MRTLIIEDNDRLATSIRLGLEQQGYAVDVATTAEDGDEMAVVNGYDLILLDVMLGQSCGIELCRRLRRQKVATPVLMLTVLSSTADKVKGLDAGADDYLTKPFEMDELLARLRSLLRRAQATEGARLQSGELVMDLHERRVHLGDTPLRLSAKEFALLEFFMRNPRRLLTRSMISESVWDMNYESSSNVIDVYVSALRRKVDRDTKRSCIETVIGSGYRFVDAPGTDERPSGQAQAT